MLHFELNYQNICLHCDVHFYTDVTSMSLSMECHYKGIVPGQTAEIEPVVLNNALLTVH